MVEGQTRTGESGPGSAGMGGNWMGSSFRDGFSSLCLLLVDPVSCLPASRPFPQTGPLTRPVSIPLSELIMALTRRLQRMVRLREEIVAVGKSVGGDVPDHDAVAIAIPRFVSGGGAFDMLERAATTLEIEESKVIPLMLQLLEYVEVVNPKSLRDPRDLEWWKEGLRGALVKLASMAEGLDLERYPSFRQLLEWKDAIERVPNPDLGDSYDRIRSDSEDIDLPESRVNDAPPPRTQNPRKAVRREGRRA